jgi:hypothetical protein
MSTPTWDNSGKGRSTAPAASSSTCTVTVQPHELTGLYGTTATCSNKTGQVYTSSYDSWGNVTSRTYSGTTATLTYDLLDHFVSWNAGSSNQDLYVCDASGSRVLRRTTQQHPFFTLEKGFLPVGQLRLGMHVLRVGGGVGVITGWKNISGVKTMYNLEVARDHTFTVRQKERTRHSGE